MVEKGVLPIGIELNGIVHRNFTVEPETGFHQIQAWEDERAQKNDIYFGLAVLAAQMQTLGTIDRSEITVELVARMHTLDIQEIRKAKVRLEQKLIEFRSDRPDKKAQKESADACQNRDTVQSRTEDAGDGS